MVRLEPLTEAEFQAFLEPAIAEYAAEHVRGGRWSQDEALEESRKEYMQLLPDGVHTAKQHLFSIRDEAGTLVRSVAQAQPGQALAVQLSDGRFDAVVSGAGGTPPKPQPRAARKEPPKSTQGDLF